MINLCVRTQTSTKNTSTMYVSNVWNTYESVMAEIKKLTLFLLILPKRRYLEWSLINRDKRGKHSNHGHVSDNVRDLIREHIRSFPARSSHYSRSDNSGRVYLSPELSIAWLYHDFLWEAWSRLWKRKPKIVSNWSIISQWKNCPSH